MKICRISALVAAALGLIFVPTATTLHIDVHSPFNAQDSDNPQHCAKKALTWLAQCSIPSDCTVQVATQALNFCRSYLHPSRTTATRFNTVIATSVTTGTATQTLTSQITTIQTSTLTTTTTGTETTTITTPTTSTLTAATSYVAPSDSTLQGVIKARHAGDQQSHCPDLSKKHLTRRPAVQLSYACQCLGIQVTTDTTTKSSATTTTTTTTKSTTTTTTTTSTTTTTTTTEITTTSTTTTSTTTTSLLVSTATAVVDYCDITYNGSGTTPGNTVVEPGGGLTGRQCCVLCFNTINCVASATGPGYCQLLIKTSPLAGAPTSPQCPLGIENYNYMPGPGTLYRGPCSPGLN